MKIDRRLELAQNKKAELEEKLEKVKGTPRQDEFRMKLEKLEGLIAHLEKE